MNPMRSSVLPALRSCQNASHLTSLDQKVLFSLYNSAPRHSRICIREIHFRSTRPSARDHNQASITSSNAIHKPPTSRIRIIDRANAFSVSSRSRRDAPPTPVTKEEKGRTSEDNADEQAEPEFEKSEKASQASQINLSARLSKEGNSDSTGAGFGEVWRLIKIARPEAKILSAAFVLLLISSAITMSIPFSIGKILDIATKGKADRKSNLWRAPGTGILVLTDLSRWYR